MILFINTSKIEKYSCRFLLLASEDRSFVVSCLEHARFLLFQQFGLAFAQLLEQHPENNEIQQSNLTIFDSLNQLASFFQKLETLFSRQATQLISIILASSIYIYTIFIMTPITLIIQHYQTTSLMQPNSSEENFPLEKDLVDIKTVKAKEKRHRLRHRNRGRRQPNLDELMNYKMNIRAEERSDRLIGIFINRSIKTHGKIYRHRERELLKNSNENTNVSQSIQQQEQVDSSPLISQNEINFSQEPEEDEIVVNSYKYDRGIMGNDQSNSSDEQIDQMFQQDAKDIQKYISTFILENNIGKCAKYRLPKKGIKIYDRFYDRKKYQFIMSELVKYEIIADVNRRIEEKSEEKYQRQIRVKLFQNFIKNRSTGENQKKVTLVASNNYHHYYLEETLIKGKRLGIITRLLPFKVDNLINMVESTYLCFIHKDRGNGRIIVTGLDNLDIPLQNPKQYSKDIENNEQKPLNANEYYFLDLDSIISSIRQYQAVQSCSGFPLINAIIQNSSVANNKKCLKERSELAETSIFNHITKTRNPSQIHAIKNIVEKEAGIFLIQGPPGTGKTQSIANFASLEQHYFQKNKPDQLCNKLMICAQSNAAVNHIARKILADKLIGRSDMPKILRLGHTEEFDESLLSINLPHLCQIKLRGTENNKDEWSAKLRWQKLLLQAKINKMMSEEYQKSAIRKEKDILFTKIRKLVEINEQLQAKKRQYDRIQLVLLKESQIVLTTLNTSGKAKFADFYCGRIRCLLIDEASQATQPSTLIPFGTLVKKVILVGDHMQLQPTVMSTNCHYTKYNRSFFERLISMNTTPFLLDTQYRMVPKLKEFPSKQFYQGRLKCGRNIIVPHSLQKLSWPSMFFNVIQGTQQKLKKSYHNKAEAQCISILIGRLLLYDNHLEIGVIAPYKSQIKYIQSELNKVPMSEKERENIKVSTVDAFQGQERDVIIISCVRSNAERVIGFVRDEKRLNVAITRAKYALFVFGNVDTLSSNETWRHYFHHHHSTNSLFDIKTNKQCDNRIRSLIQLQYRKV